MEKITKIELLVYNQPAPQESFDFTQEVVKFLIERRVQHCYSELQEAIKNNSAGYLISIDSQTIVYKNGNHFSIPVYNHMIDFLNGSIPFDLMIVQQAIRSYNALTPEEDQAFEDEILHKYSKDWQDTFRVITDLIVLV